MKGERGLSVHVSCWCAENQSDLTYLLQQHRVHTQTIVEEEKRRIRIEKEEQAEREQKEMEEDALRAQRLREFESLAVSGLPSMTRVPVFTISVSLVVLIWVRMLNTGHQAFPLATIAFPVGIMMTHLPLLLKNQQIFILRLCPLLTTPTWIPSNLMQANRLLLIPQPMFILSLMAMTYSTNITVSSRPMTLKS